MTIEIGKDGIQASSERPKYIGCICVHYGVPKIFKTLFLGLFL